MLTQCPSFIQEKVHALSKLAVVTQEGGGAEVQGQNLWPWLRGSCTSRQEEEGAGGEPDTAVLQRPGELSLAREGSPGARSGGHWDSTCLCLIPRDEGLTWREEMALVPVNV